MEKNKKSTTSGPIRAPKTRPLTFMLSPEDIARFRNYHHWYCIHDGQITMSSLVKNILDEQYSSNEEFLTFEKENIHSNG